MAKMGCLSYGFLLLKTELLFFNYDLLCFLLAVWLFSCSLGLFKDLYLKLLKNLKDICICIHVLFTVMCEPFTWSSFLKLTRAFLALPYFTIKKSKIQNNMEDSYDSIYEDTYPSEKCSKMSVKSECEIYQVLEEKSNWELCGLLRIDPIPADSDNYSTMFLGNTYLKENMKPNVPFVEDEPKNNEIEEFDSSHTKDLQPTATNILKEENIFQLLDPDETNSSLNSFDLFVNSSICNAKNMHHLHNSSSNHFEMHYDNEDDFDEVDESHFFNLKPTSIDQILKDESDLYSFDMMEDISVYNYNNFNIYNHLMSESSYISPNETIDNSEKSHFIFSTLEDDDYEWSDSDNDCDELDGSPIYNESLMPSNELGLDDMPCSFIFQLEHFTVMESTNNVYNNAKCNSFYENEASGMAEINKKWNQVYSEEPSLQKEFKVKFNLIPKVNTMVCWDFAYRDARRGIWQQYAIERCHFKSRINKLESILNVVLSPSHRDTVFKERFKI